jgi:feruloyl-CoA synthase
MSTPFRPFPFLERSVALSERADGTLIASCTAQLKALEPHIPNLLRRNAKRRPNHVWMAQRRGSERAWHRLRYGDASSQVDAVTQFLLGLRRTGATVMVLSGNSLEHGMLELAAMQARMPYAPITPAYASMAADLSRLKSMAQLLEPAVIFVQNARLLEPAIRAIGEDAWVICVDDPISHPRLITWKQLAQTEVTKAVDDSVAQITHDTVAKYQFTSGSTGTPKAVIVTQGMLCTAMAMTSQMVQWGDEKPETVLLDWLPWSHVAGGHAVFNGVLEDGGTLYIDDGRPTPQEFPETLQNLREISPVRFSGMPVAYAMLADALEHDEVLGQTFFKNLRRLTYSGARLPDTVHAALQRHAVHHTGYRIPIVSAYGSTETSAAVTYVHWATERTGLIGLPHPGVEIKLIPLPDGDRYEVRVRSAAVTPGYLKQPELTASSFDDEGFFCMGDAASFVDRSHPEEGLIFAGRVAEEFKLQTGVFVRVGALRVAGIDATAPLLQDLVITGADQRYVGALAWLNLSACRDATQLPDADFNLLSTHPELRQAIVDRLRAHNAQHPASSMRIRRLYLLDPPPSIEGGETNDKGYINQRKVLENRSDCVMALYQDEAQAHVLRID